jgi:hypothetical protein
MALRRFCIVDSRCSTLRNSYTQIVNKNQYLYRIGACINEVQIILLRRVHDTLFRPTLQTDRGGTRFTRVTNVDEANDLSRVIWANQGPLVGQRFP